MLNSRSGLAIELSKIPAFKRPKFKLEQYSTPSEIAADMLWTMHMRGQIEGKVIADLGCGTGILGIGALLLGAKKVYFVDIDSHAIDLAKENKVDGEKTFLNIDVDDFHEEADSVIMNPPFGIKQKHADKRFLEKAMEISGSITSLHKSESETFIRKLSQDRGFAVEGIVHYSYQLPATMEYHRKRMEKIEVGCWFLKKR